MYSLLRHHFPNFHNTKTLIYYIKVSGIASGNKLIKNWYDILTCEDMISSHVKISMISVTSSFSLKLYLNSLVYHRNIFGSSSKVFGHPRKFSEMFGNVCLAFGTILKNLWKSSESGRKSSENHQNRRHQYVYIIKRILDVSSKIRILCYRGKNNISLVRCAHSWAIVLATRT